MPAAVCLVAGEDGSALIAVMIGIDPHKGSRTAVAVGAVEEPLGKLRVRACPDQAGKLVAWAQAWPERTWAVEGARGLGRLLAQQLVAAGERVLDVQPPPEARGLGLPLVGSGEPRFAKDVAGHGRFDVLVARQAFQWDRLVHGE